MADIHRTRSHRLGLEGAKQRLKQIADDLAGKHGFAVTFTDAGAEVSGTGLKRGAIALTDSSLTVEVDLSLLGRPFKGKVSRMIDEALDANFGTAP